MGLLLWAFAVYETRIGLDVLPMGSPTENHTGKFSLDADYRICEFCHCHNSAQTEKKNVDYCKKKTHTCDAIVFLHDVAEGDSDV